MEDWVDSVSETDGKSRPLSPHLLATAISTSKPSVDSPHLVLAPLHLPHDFACAGYGLLEKEKQPSFVHAKKLKRGAAGAGIWVCWNRRNLHLRMLRSLIEVAPEEKTCIQWKPNQFLGR